MTRLVKSIEVAYPSGIFVRESGGHRPAAVYQSSEIADPLTDCVRNHSSLRRASGNLLEVDVDQFGQRALFYDGIPLYVDDFISDAQVQGSSGGVCSSIYAVKFGQGVGVLGLEHGGVQIERVGELETKDATRWWPWTQRFRH